MTNERLNGLTNSQFRGYLCSNYSIGDIQRIIWMASEMYYSHLYHSYIGDNNE